MKKSLAILAFPMLLAGCGITRIVTVAPAPEPVPVQVVTPAPTTVVVAQPQPQPQPQVVYAQPVSTTVTYPRSQATRVTTIDVTPLTSDISLYLDLQAVAAAFAQANSVEEFEMILNSNSYMISNLDLNRDGFIDYLRVLETLDGRTHVILIQAVLAANIYQDVATLVVEMGYSTPYVQIIGAPYIYGTNYIIEPVYYKRPPLFDRFGRPNYAYWRSPYHWDYFPHHYGRHAPYHLGHYQAYVTTYMEHHHYCHDVHYVDHYHYGRYAEVARPMSRGDYAQQYPDQAFSRRTTATYIPAGSQTATRVTNARHLSMAVEQSGVSRTTTTTRSTATSQRSSSATTTSRSSATASQTTNPQPARANTTQQTTSQRATQTGTSGRSGSATLQTSSATTQPARSTTTQPARASQQVQQPAQSTTTTRVRTSGTTSTTRTPATTGTSTRSSSSSSRSAATGTSTRSGNTAFPRSEGTTSNSRSNASTRR